MVAPQTPSPFPVRDRAGVAAYPRTLRFPRPLEEDTQPKLKKYYQPRKSHRTVSMTLQGTKVALYGGASLAVTDSAGSKVPLRLEFEICSRGDVVGRLVRTKHHRHVSCAVVMDSTKTKPMKSQRILVHMIEFNSHTF